MNSNKPYLVDVPVKVNIWTRQECQRRQFEVLKKARPSIMFLQSDGGRNEQEWEAIRQNRKIFDEEIDWECEVYKVYEDENLGMYAMMKIVSEYIWSRVDRCIFLEDDYVPSISYFRFCAEMLEKYKDDERIQMICGNNVMETYPDAEPNDYFFTELGWSIWGVATWKRSFENDEFPFAYANNKYVKRCLKDNMDAFWYEMVDMYCRGILYRNHTPGNEYTFMVNSILNHRLSIVPTKNMICNIGEDGAHASTKQNQYWIKNPKVFNLETYEIEFPIKHPRYVIDDKHFGRMYAKKLGHIKRTGIKKIAYIAFRTTDLLVHGGLLAEIKKRLHPTQER